VIHGGIAKKKKSDVLLCAGNLVEAVIVKNPGRNPLNSQWARLEDDLKDAAEEIDILKKRGIREHGKDFKNGDATVFAALARIAPGLQQDLLKQLQGCLNGTEIKVRLPLLSVAWLAYARKCGGI
jgi:hypothetical protein